MIIGRQLIRTIKLINNDGAYQHGSLKQKLAIKLGDISDFMDILEPVVRHIESSTSVK
jgi:hypothetical protein